MYNEIGSTAAVRRPISLDVLQSLEELAAILVDMQSLAATKLEPIMSKPEPQHSKEVDIPKQVYPPLFDAMRVSIDTARYNAINIRRALELCET